MKNFKQYNENIRNKMLPKSDEEVMSIFMKLTPYAMLWKLDDDGVSLDGEVYDKYRTIAEERIEDAEEDLESIFKIYVDTDRQVKTLELFNGVIRWVDRNGGNKENLIQYGIKDFAEQMESSFESNNRHDWEQLYSYDSIFLFQRLLKQLAIDEVSLNNKEIGQFING